MKVYDRSQFKKGSTLIAVFWISAIMGLALVASLKVSRYQTEVAASQITGIEAFHYAEMGINVAINSAVQEWDTQLLNQYFAEEDGGFEARILSEGGRFNLNYILFNEDKALLRLIFAEWGIDFDTSSEIADALIDWVDANDTSQLNGAEFEYYEGQGFRDRPFNRAFYDLDEARLVRGMDIVEASNPNWRDWFTLQSSGGLDVSEAPAEFLAIATESEIEAATSVVEVIDGADGIRNTEDDQPLSVQQALANLGVVDESGVIQSRLNSEDPVTRIESIGYAGSVRRKIVLIVSSRTGVPAIRERKVEVIQ